ncbi:MAG: Tm-1-like ATP-binding domain-containing protein [Pseudomonadota bacterium]
MAGADVLVLATLDTKSTEAGYLVDRIAQLGHRADVLDTTLDGADRQLPGTAKLEAMATAAAVTRRQLEARLDGGARVIVGLGGGTGAQIIAAAFADLPFALPKVLVTTMASDPRPDTADNSIILIPSVADLMGLNPTVRQVLQNAAAVVAGLADHGVPHPDVDAARTVGLTALGVTGAGVTAANDALRSRGYETTVFHANGFGGKAFVRWAGGGAFSGVIDYTIHELNRFTFGGRHVVPTNRFTAAAEAGLPQVVLPGAINFYTGEPLDQLSAEERRRPHYSHSPHFTHLALDVDEMASAGTALGKALATSATPTTLVVPLGGFSSEDRPGGAIENPAGREAFVEAARDAAGTRVHVRCLDRVHVNDPAAAEAAVAALLPDLVATSAPLS